MDLMRYKKVYLLISVLALVPAAAFLFLYRLNLSIDFTGGAVFELEFEKNVAGEKQSITEVFKEKGVGVEGVEAVNDKVLVVRTDAIDNSRKDEVEKALHEKFGVVVEKSFETVGSAVGRETTRRAFSALGIASVGIVLYITYAFRNVPKPYSGFRFGISAILAMFHDALVVVGVFSFLGRFYGVRIDPMFVTAILTIIGFSVHDSIVVFDRIRENLGGKFSKGTSFSEIVNYSIVETLNRSFATSLTVLIVLLALFLLGGGSTREFVLALLIGIASGTYSSIFVAAPVLVMWEEIAVERGYERGK
ncbi:protein translocase subunit SecF [candidate division WWE3 bacterium]|nr:protein translocase subunit SecF [candidate division WWE3 bacterium]